MCLRSIIAAASAGFIAVSFLSGPVSAQAMQHNHAMHGNHAMGHDGGETVWPVMPGQDLFGAITEIVRILNEDPDTDWASVNIDALRAHLLDMHLVATETAPVAATVPGGMRFTLDRSGLAGAAAERMMAAHGPLLVAEFGWEATLEAGDRDIVWTVRGKEASVDEIKIRALGFFGLLASGAHHQSHHLAMARGDGHPH